MFSEMASALASVKTVGDFTTFIIKAKVTDAVREKAIESQSVIVALQNTMMTLQAQYQSLLQEKDSLEKKLIEIQDWKAEAANYSLQEIEPGIFVYAYDPKIQPSAPKHWLCAKCYHDRQTSILERTGNHSKGISVAV